MFWPIACVTAAVTATQRSAADQVCQTDSTDLTYRLQPVPDTDYSLNRSTAAGPRYRLYSLIQYTFWQLITTHFLKLIPPYLAQMHCELNFVCVVKFSMREGVIPLST